MKKTYKPITITLVMLISFSLTISAQNWKTTGNPLSTDGILGITSASTADFILKQIIQRGCALLILGMLA